MNSFSISVISLKSAVKRRELVQTCLGASSLGWEFFDALTRLPDGIEYSEYRAIVVKGRRLSFAELGCAGSHIECLRKFLRERKTDYMVILEDDVMFDVGFDIASLLLGMKANQIEYCRLYSHTFPRYRKLGKIGHRIMLRFRDPPLGAQAYVVSLSGAKTIVDSIGTLDRPIDDHIDRYWVSGVAPYAIFPYPVLEMQMPSSVLTKDAGIKERNSTQKILRAMNIFADRARQMKYEIANLSRDYRTKFD